MRHLWNVMAEIYGHRWSSQFGDSAHAMATWAKGLADLSREELGHGLRALLERADGWPPNLPEFRALCRPPAPEPCHQLYRALPSSPSRRECAQQAVAAMRAALTGRSAP